MIKVVVRKEAGYKKFWKKVLKSEETIPYIKGRSEFKDYFHNNEIAEHYPLELKDLVFTMSHDSMIVTPKNASKIIKWLYSLETAYPIDIYIKLDDTWFKIYF